jgi:ABC-type arginine/histidine transport system permease subunit
MWHIPEIIFLSKSPPGKFVLWKTLVTGIIIAVILVLALIGNNRMPGNVYKRSMNVFLGALLTINLWAVWNCAKQLRSLRKLRANSKISA